MRPGKHYSTMGSAGREYMVTYLDSLNTGFSIDQMCDDYPYRTIACARYYQEMVAHSALPRFVVRRKGLFNAQKSCNKTSTTPNWERMKMVFTMPLSGYHNWAIQQTGAKARLLSFFYLTGKTYDIENYVKTGEWPTR